MSHILGFIDSISKNISLGLPVKGIDIKVILVTIILTSILTFVLRDLILRLLKKAGLLLKNKFFSKEQILGKYFGYYLHKDAPTAKPILRESHWIISSDFKSGHYVVTIYKDFLKKEIRYKGKMWLQQDHYLLRFDSKTYEETIFERKMQVTKADEYPIVGIGLAVATQGRKIRASVSVLSKKQLTLDDFHKIVEEYEVTLEKDTYNLRINR